MVGNAARLLSGPAAMSTQFDRTNSHVVRSLRQSHLLEAWLSHLKRTQVLPTVKDFAALRDYREAGELSFFQVTRRAPEIRYFVVQESVSFRTFYGASSEGRFLDESLKPRSLQVGRRSLDECVRQSLPIFAAFSMDNESGEQIICERLTLPFGVGSTEVSDLVTSLKVTSWSRDKLLLARPGRQEPKYSFRAVIEPD
jgi:hypothetical protein